MKTVIAFKISAVFNKKQVLANFSPIREQANEKKNHSNGICMLKVGRN